MKAAKSAGLVGTLLLVVSAAMLMTAGPAQAEVSCHKINAKGVGQDLGGGMTEAQIIGGGLLQGTTEAAFVITADTPPAFPFEGTVTFTTKKATLTVTITGTFDVSTGNFAASGPVSGATGKLAGATGTLTFEGTQDLSTGVFTEDVTGLICVDLAP